ncbi:flagellin-like hook-associated protein FlgL [Labrenzia sp. EL_208]|uniref:Flagellin n=1 Tax=Roseibium album TaxID=311410 RepID=A0A0M7AL36_9HYPH|nr:flagellin [Roseibium album]MBG6143181.1 flagellin-like hook-associated protein FlgL [Labrenzia sp. EL_142]MBG6157082.1 flagellin-like hook-associated protein FlgL [Labrenzia sp. EL_162]MBG6166470.1 flagellin-like hook-associated protein FlgL [Labrenzia sp. EL_195]MBG6172332.1 flagellin-like hook-associated protein FlgL [Labrenzia sp. EL_132]MBG6194977.1 flagellin-like hook-associated protein FlgL [Labrenzia sp. EL_159]MBG6203442.1 flagellin-like hook-associated protein FlgL [Labrenzia sp. 
MSDIVLSSAVRDNLLSLKQTANLQSVTQTRLATGMKVNTALDNPNSFFTAQSLNDRASDLANLLDNMGQAVQTIKAADKGITSITKLVESAKAIANQALQTSSEFERKQFASQYNDILEQIEDMARDSSYKGKNLLAGAGNELEVIFNEDSTSNLTVNPVDFTDTTLDDGLNLDNLDTGGTGTASFNLFGGTGTLALTGLQASSNLTDLAAWSTGDQVTITDSSGTTTLTVGTDITTVQDYVDALNDLSGVHTSFNESTDSISITSGNTNPIYVSKDNAGGGTATSGGATGGTTTTLTVSSLSSTATLISSGGFQAGDTITITDGNGFEPASIEIDSETTVSDLVSFIDNVKGLDATFSGGSISLLGEVSFDITSSNADFNRTTLGSTSGTVGLSAAASEFKSDTDIDRTLQAINAALDELRTAARSMGTSLSTVEIRTDFTQNMINTLEVGAGELTIADMNEEGANMLALQTRQQLSSTALSLANQADQSVLSLFG